MGRRHRRFWWALLAVGLVVVIIGSSLSKKRGSAPPGRTPTAIAVGTATSSAGPTGIAATSTAAVTSPTGTTVAGACQVTAAKRLDEGGDESWSRVNGLIAYEHHDAQGIAQLYVIRADGSGRQCLSCSPHPGAPPTNRNKFMPSWDPNGKYIILQGEMAHHPADILRGVNLFNELLLNGLWNDLYVTTPDGSQWTKLTDTGSPQTDGVMNPSFSPDGRQVLWSRLMAPASSADPWGRWRLLLADFVVNNGVPALTNIRDITPAGARFVEAHGFSPDGRTVIFTSDLQSPGKWSQEIWTEDLATGALHDLTHNAAWNEHASYTLGGGRITYMSSQSYPGTLFQADLMIMNADGSDKQQLTHFNVPGYPEYDPATSMAMRGRWNAAGNQLAVTQQMAKSYPARYLWVLTFAGRCGA